MTNEQRMETTELLKRVRAIEIRTRGLSKQIFSGEYHSAFKGRGMAFSENREYQHGDEIRTIDWNVTARMGQPYVKVFEEERELTAVILADVSASGNFGTRKQLKRELITELAAVLAFSAIQNNDKIGIILYSNQIEKNKPPKKGRSHVLRIIRELIDFKPASRLSDIKEPLRFLTQVIKKRCTAFLLSDFITAGYEDVLKIANRKHDLVALRVKDPREDSLPECGLVHLLDSETGEMIWIDTSDRSMRKGYEAQAKMQDERIRLSFSKAGVDAATLYTNKSYIQPLSNLFKRRGA
jgi:uncharacterized protein (DUF58 family)